MGSSKMIISQQLKRLEKEEDNRPEYVKTTARERSGKTDKWKAYRKAYHKTDKYKAYQKAYRKTEKSKAYQRAYRRAKQELIKNNKEEFNKIFQKAKEDLK